MKLILATVLTSFLISCHSSESSHTKGLPFVCQGESASEIYFDESHKSYLAGRFEGTDVDTLLTFGDSLSDTGELGRKSNDLMVPKCKYWFNHFSNGPVWSEYVAGGAGWNLISYAIGGSGTSLQRGNSLLSWLAYWNPFKIKDTFQDLVLLPLPVQIEKFSRDMASGKIQLVQERTIVSVWAGPNNYFLQGRDVQNQEGRVDKVKAQALVDQTVNDLRLAIARVKELGFKRISIGNMPVLAGLPPDPSNFIKLASNETLEFLSLGHNAGVFNLVKEFKQQGLDIMLFQTNEILHEVSSSPAAFGFDTVDACYSGNIFGLIPSGSKEFCKHPLRQRSWDYPHPNTRMHCHYASQFVADARLAGWLTGGEDLRQACLDMRTKQGVE